MLLIQWNDSYNVNVKIIDKQHQKLAAIINELHDAMGKRKTKEVLGKVIDGLISYTETHFITEETYFNQFGYKDKDAHKKEHNEFVDKVLDFKQEFDNGRLMLSIEIMIFLKDWLVKHIQISDKKYSPLFNERGLE